MPNIVFKNITKSYDGINEAVSNLNLEIKDGELMCILGPSGCGKSSTLRMLAGLESITDGEIFVDDKIINNLPPEDRNIAMVFENFALYPHLDVYNNLAMPLIAKKLEKKNIKQKVREIANLLEISEQLTKKPNELSGGQRQRVSLARCLIKNSKIFLMDEPLGHLEAYLRVLLRTEIRRIHDSEKTTTVYITHDQEEASSLSDKIAVMDRGILQQVDTLINLLDKPTNQFVAEFIGNFPINLISGSIKFEKDNFIFSSDESSKEFIFKKEVNLNEFNNSNYLLGLRPEDFIVKNENSSEKVKGIIKNIELIGVECLINLESEIGNINILTNFDERYRNNEKLLFYPNFDNLKIFDPKGNNLVKYDE